MNRFMAILGLAVIPLFSPLVGKAQFVSPLHRSPFGIDKLSTRRDTTHTWVYGEITNNAKKEASKVYIFVRWFDKSRKVVDHYTTIVSNLAPGGTLPFRAFAKKNPDIVRYDVMVDRVRFVPLRARLNLWQRQAKTKTQWLIRIVTSAAPKLRGSFLTA